MEPVFIDLRRAILEYNRELGINCANKIVTEKLDLMAAIDVMTEAIRQVGDGFARGELWLPDLVGAGEVMSSVMPLIEKEIKKQGKTRETLGIVVIGTVSGDIHSIGKSMVASLLSAEGFEVHDLGVNVCPEDFISALKEFDAELIAMSALLTTTAQGQKKVIDILKKEGLREKVKIIVGGGAINQEFADSIGADGYDPTAPGGVKIARRLLGK